LSFDIFLFGDGNGYATRWRRSSGVCGGDGVAVSLVELAFDGVRTWSDDDGSEGWEEIE
jgi:hypothetical protein